MSELYVGVDNHTTPNASFTIPTDGDDLAATSVDDAFQQGADNWAHAAAAYPDTQTGGTYSGAGAVNLAATWSWSPPTGAKAINVSGTAAGLPLVNVAQNGTGQGLLVAQTGAGPALEVRGDIFGAVHVRTGTTWTFDAGMALLFNVPINRTQPDNPNAATAWRVLRPAFGPLVTSAVSGETQEILHIPDTLAASITYNLTLPPGDVGVEFTITGNMGAGAAVLIYYSGTQIHGTAGVFTLAAGLNQSVTLIFDPKEVTWYCKAVIV